jgi:hypothetical protein
MDDEGPWKRLRRNTPGRPSARPPAWQSADYGAVLAVETVWNRVRRYLGLPEDARLRAVSSGTRASTDHTHATDCGTLEAAYSNCGVYVFDVDGEGRLTERFRSPERERRRDVPDVARCARHKAGRLRCWAPPAEPYAVQAALLLGVHFHCVREVEPANGTWTHVVTVEAAEDAPESPTSPMTPQTPSRVGRFAKLRMIHDTFQELKIYGSVEDCDEDVREGMRYIDAESGQSVERTHWLYEVNCYFIPRPGGVVVLGSMQTSMGSLQGSVDEFVANAHPSVLRFTRSVQRGFFGRGVAAATITSSCGPPLRSREPPRALRGAWTTDGGVVTRAPARSLICFA